MPQKRAIKAEEHTSQHITSSPTMQEEETTLRKAAQRHGKEALNALIELGRHGEKENTRLAAWKILLDRGYGRLPAQEQSSAPQFPPTLVFIPYSNSSSDSSSNSSFDVTHAQSLHDNPRHDHTDRD